MTLSISEAELANLLSGKAVVLVEHGLSHLVPVSLGYWQTLEFHGQNIGRKEGSRHPLDDTRLPLAVILVVQTKGSRFGSELSRVLKSAGHPIMPRVISIAKWRTMGSGAQSLVAKALNLALETALVSDTYSPLEMNREISDLRQQLDRERAKNDRVGLLLSHIGLSGDEVAMDNSVGGDFTTVSLPIRQKAPVSLRNLKKIAIFNLSNIPSRVIFEITVAGSVAYSATVDTPGKPGWLRINLPEPLVQSAADVVFHLNTLNGDPKFAATDGNLTCRFYWTDADHLESHDSGSQISLGSIRRPRKSGVLVSGVWLDAGAKVHATTEDVSGLANARVSLVRHGEVALASSDRLKPESINPSFQLVSEPAPLAGRYDVVIEIKKTTFVRREVAWRVSVVNPDMKTLPPSFAVARFATLRGAMDYCDGPRQEELINSEVGFAVLSAGDGQPFMQTHPVAERVIGAVFPQLVPLGTNRIWVDVENAHPKADSIEFILAVRKELLKETAQDWLAAMSLSKSGSLTIADLPGGDVLARITIAPGTAQTLDIQLRAPLSRQSHLYCLVNGIGSSSRYGWCRWNSIAFAIDEGMPLTISP